jgi:hypothetical protein
VEALQAQLQSAVQAQETTLHQLEVAKFFLQVSE